MPIPRPKITDTMSPPGPPSQPLPVIQPEVSCDGKKFAALAACQLPKRGFNHLLFSSKRRDLALQRVPRRQQPLRCDLCREVFPFLAAEEVGERKRTRLNSSH